MDNYLYDILHKNSVLIDILSARISSVEHFLLKESKITKEELKEVFVKEYTSLSEKKAERLKTIIEEKAKESESKAKENSENNLNSEDNNPSKSESDAVSDLKEETPLTCGCGSSAPCLSCHT